MRLLILFSALAVALTPFLLAGRAGAQGCGPTRLKVSESIMLEMPPAEVWAVIGNFHDLSWDQQTVSATGTGGNEPDKAIRSVKLLGGSTFKESLYKYSPDGMSYSYHIDAIDVSILPVQNVSATLDVMSRDGGRKSEVRWRAAFYRYLRSDEGAPDAADAQARSVVAAFLRRGLGSLKTKLDAKS